MFKSQGQYIYFFMFILKGPRVLLSPRAPELSGPALGASSKGSSAPVAMIGGTGETANDNA